MPGVLIASKMEVGEYYVHANIARHDIKALVTVTTQLNGTTYVTFRSWRWRGDFEAAAISERRLSEGSACSLM